jgi:lysophospholipase L1-like esterase
MNSLKRRFVEAAVILLIVLVGLVGLEAMARLVRFATSSHPEDPPLIVKQPWGKQLLADQARLSSRHEDYVEFREDPLRSATINVDERGTRAVPGSCDPQRATFRVLLFGGSTMFGYGVPDEFTIPAYLARALAGPGRCVAVTNYGSAWWQSSQSVVQLAKALREGARPDAVVFYDGVNDVSVVIRGGRPGRIAPEAEAMLRDAFDDDIPWAKLARKSVLVRALARRLAVSVPAEPVEMGLAKQIAGLYVHNVRAVEALGREYGFSAHFFLQPFPVIAAKPRTGAESAVIERWNQQHPHELAFIHAAYEEWRKAPYLQGNRNFSDISNLFDAESAELYADTQHLLPEGNRLVAERIAREIRVQR